MSKPVDPVRAALGAVDPSCPVLSEPRITCALCSAPGIHCVGGITFCSDHVDTWYQGLTDQAVASVAVHRFDYAPDGPAPAPDPKGLPPVIYVAATGRWFPKAYEHVATVAYVPEAELRRLRDWFRRSMFYRDLGQTNEELRVAIAERDAALAALRAVVAATEGADMRDIEDRLLFAIEAARALLTPKA